MLAGFKTLIYMLKCFKFFCLDAKERKNQDWIFLPHSFLYF